MKLKSPVFTNIFPVKYSAYGENISPSFKYRKVPRQTEKFRLICVGIPKPFIIIPEPKIYWEVFFNYEDYPSDIPVNLSWKAKNKIEQKQNYLGKRNYQGPDIPGSYIFTLQALDDKGIVLDTVSITTNFKEKENDSNL